MTILTQGRRGRFRLERSPEDNLAPYRCLFTLPDGRRYSGRLRSHPDNRGAGYWYEGFVSAFNPIAHARDEELKRYPSRPPAEPERWDLMPTQIKLNPYPDGYQNYLRTDLIGEVWLAGEGEGEANRSALYTIRADYRDHASIIAEGRVEAYRRP